MLIALKNSTARLILATSFTGYLGDGIFLLALLLVATKAGATPLWIGVIGAVQSFWWLFSVPLSLFVDRLGPGPLLTRVRPLRLVVAAGALLSTALFNQTPLLLLLIICSAAWGFLEVLSDSALSTLPALLLHEKEYDASYSLIYSTQRVAGLILGPVISGALFVIASWAPFASAFIFLLLSFLIQLPLLGRAEAQPQKQSSPLAPTSFLAEASSGWTHISADRFLRAVMITLIGIVITEEIVGTVVLPYARDGHLILHWESILAYLRSIAGVVSIGAALLTAGFARLLGQVRVMGVAALMGVAAPLLMAIQPSVAWILSAMVVSNAAEALWVPLAQTAIARRTPKQLLARTRATLRLITWGSLPLASLIGGALATRFGIPLTLYIAASMVAISSLFGIWPLALSPAEANQRNA